MDRHQSRGQTLTEYIVIIALCAIGLLLVSTVFGNDIRQIFFTSSASLRQGEADDIAYASAFDEPHDLSRLSGGGGSASSGGGSGGSGGGGGDDVAGDEADNPYEWNASAKRWYDPDTNLFVSFSEAGKYVEDPYMHLD